MKLVVIFLIMLVVVCFLSVIVCSLLHKDKEEPPFYDDEDTYVG